MSTTVREYAIRVCDQCIRLEGRMCNNPECIFCRKTMEEVGVFLAELLIRDDRYGLTAEGAIAAASGKPAPVCVGCNKHPDQIEEYVEIAAAEGYTPDAYVRAEEGTFNRENGHFLCTDCYIEAGSPSSRNGWVAP